MSGSFFQKNPVVDRKPAPISIPLIPQDEWRRMTETQRLQSLLGMSTDRCLDWLSLDPLGGRMSHAQMGVQAQIIRAVLTTCVKLGIEEKRLEKMRDQVLGNLIDGLDKMEEDRKK